jgi:hypothetical protein
VILIDVVCYYHLLQVGLESMAGFGAEIGENPPPSNGGLSLESMAMAGFGP